MTLEKLIAIADEAYPDGLVGAAAEDMEVGDTLAEFIVRELRDSFDPKLTSADQLAEAVRVMNTATQELESVEAALREVHLAGDVPTEGTRP